MGKLIDAEKLKKHYAWWEGGTRTMTMDEAKSDFDTIIDLQPTVEPVKHGRWEETDYSAYDDTYRCSACGEVWEFIEGTPKDNGANYCPNCGARMDEVEE